MVWNYVYGRPRYIIDLGMMAIDMPMNLLVLLKS